MTTPPGKFIVIEGMDGVGKTTLATAYTRHLNQHGYPTVYTREPGGISTDYRTPEMTTGRTSTMAEELREVVLRDRTERVGAMTELLIMYAAREQHLKEVILPYLEEGVNVICDRFTLTTYLYQVFGGRLDLEDLHNQLENKIVEECQPTLTVALTAPFALAKERLEQRNMFNRLDVIDQHKFVSYQDELMSKLPLARSMSFHVDLHDQEFMIENLDRRLFNQPLGL